MGERGNTKMFLNAEYLTELMKGKGWTVRQLAAKSWSSSSTISKIITGKRGEGHVPWQVLEGPFLRSL
jgi:transcriptional regulator with XRE-family HTH domain